MINSFRGIFLFVYILLSVRFDSIIAENQLTSKNITEESITVQFDNWFHQKISSCKLQVANNDGKFYDVATYYNLSNSKTSLSKNNFIEYIGGEDGTCSFTIYPNRQPDFFKYGGYGALNRKMRVVESYNTRDKNMPFGGCPIGHHIVPICDFIIAFCLNYHDTELGSFKQTVKKITRKAPNTDKTITIFTPTEQHTIKKCSLYVKTPLFNDDQLIMTYFDRLDVFHSPLKTPGYKYIGDKDNSCSIEIHNLTDAQLKFMEKSVRIEVDVVEENHHLYCYKYEFFMNSLSWWQSNYYSRVFLWPIMNILSVISSVDPQYF